MSARPLAELIGATETYEAALAAYEVASLAERDAALETLRAALRAMTEARHKVARERWT